MADKIQLKDEIFPKRYVFIELLEQIENCLCGEDVFILIGDFITEIASSPAFAALSKKDKEQISKIFSNIKNNTRVESELEKIKARFSKGMFNDGTDKTGFITLVEQVIHFNKIKELFTKIEIDTDLSQLFSAIQNISKNSEISNILSKYNLTKDITFAEKLKLISSLPEESVKDVLAKSKQAAIFARIVDSYLSTFGADEMVWENSVPSSLSPSLGQLPGGPPPPPGIKPGGPPPPQTGLHNEKTNVCNAIKHLLNFNKKTIGQENLERLNQLTLFLERKQLESSNITVLENNI